MYVIFFHFFLHYLHFSFCYFLSSIYTLPVLSPSPIEPIWLINVYRMYTDYCQFKYFLHSPRDCRYSSRSTDVWVWSTGPGNCSLYRHCWLWSTASSCGKLSSWCITLSTLRCNSGSTSCLKCDRNSTAPRLSRPSAPETGWWKHSNKETWITIKHENIIGFYFLQVSWIVLICRNVLSLVKWTKNLLAKQVSNQ